MRAQQLLALSGLILAGNVAIASKLEHDDVPSRCWDVCAPVVSVSKRCDDQNDEDDAEVQCICDWGQAKTQVPLCAACVSHYQTYDRRDVDKDIDVDNDTGDEHDGGDDDNDGDEHDGGDDDNDGDEHDGGDDDNDGDEHDGGDDDNEALDIVRTCGFSTTTYNAAAATTLRPSATATGSAANAASTGGSSDSGAASATPNAAADISVPGAAAVAIAGLMPLAWL